jgi:SAM-dependent methyltransferase
MATVVNGKRSGMNQAIFPPPIYTLVRYADRYNVDKTALDCGAGGRKPPLALFFQHGYKAYGIDLSDAQLTAATDFAEREKIELNMVKADMRWIPFRDATFGCVYSWNASVHLTKEDTELAVGEMLRVLKKGGLLYTNFIWGKGRWEDLGEERERGEFWTIIDGEDVVHSCFSEAEADRFFEKVDLLYKQRRQTALRRKGKLRNEAYLDYIVRK